MRDAAARGEHRRGKAVRRANSLIAAALLVSVEDSTDLTIGHPVRRYMSFQEAADETAQSRLYGGIHFPMGNDNGKALGRCVGRMVLARLHTRAQPAR